MRRRKNKASESAPVDENLSSSGFPRRRPSAATPEALSPGAAGSKTVTLKPALAKPSATADPKAPAPATATDAPE